MAGKKLDLGEFAKSLNVGVSNLNTGREQIEYIDIDLLDDDPRNFYELSGIEQLASNIQLCGLQQPVRVRKGESGRYTIVSGHRRRAALRKLVEDGLEQYRQVPCIPEREDISPAMQELRLIYANSDTRKMSNYDIAKQAERVTELLYQLQAEGVEFPGRMRDHVAEAVKVSKSKLARLNVIMENLQQPFSVQFKTGELTEQAAYALARLPADIQKDVAESIGEKAKTISGGAAENLLEKAAGYYEKAAVMQCPEQGQCTNLMGMLKATAASPYSWHSCDGMCCMSCYHASGCRGKCKVARQHDKDQKAEDERRKEKQEKERQKEQERLKKKSCANARRLLPLIEAAGLKDSNTLNFEYSPIKIKKLREYADGKTGKEYLYGEWFVPKYVDKVREIAKTLDCTTDFLLGLTDDPKPPQAAQPDGQMVLAGWMPGGTNPVESGWCACMMVLDPAKPIPKVLWWDGYVWRFRQGGEEARMEPVAWMRLPEYEGGTT